MNREKMIEQKLKAIDDLRKEINLLSKLELKRLYKIKDPASNFLDEHIVFETWGYIVSFNKLTIRFRIIASNNSLYTGSHRWTGRNDIKNVANFYYAKLYRSYSGPVLTPAKKDDLPLLVGLEYKFPELELILKGKIKVKLDL